MNGSGDSIGTMPTGALIAREIELAHAGAPAVGHAEDEPCANCGTVRQGAYCHRCGQAGHVHRNLGALIHDVAHGVFHFEGKIWHTLPLLAWRPGELTRRYVDGERAKFVSPMALFLFSVFLMFAVVSNLAGHGKQVSIGTGIDLAQANTKVATLAAERDATTDAAARAAIDGRLADARQDVRVLKRLLAAGIGDRGTIDPAKALEGRTLTHEEVHTGVDWLDGMLIHAAKNPELLLYKMKSYGYKYSWALIPLSLPFVWLLFALRRDVGLYDHAIFSIYSLSFMSLMVVVLTLLGVLGVPSAIMVLVSLLIPPIHMYRQLEGAYRLGRFGAGWRTVALLFVTAITSTLFLTFLFYLGSD